MQLSLRTYEPRSIVRRLTTTNVNRKPRGEEPTGTTADFLRRRGLRIGARSRDISGFSPALCALFVHFLETSEGARCMMMHAHHLETTSRPY